MTRNGGLSGIAFSSDGETIAAAASAESTITLVVPATGEVVKQIEWKEGDPLSGRKLAFLPRSNVLATADGNQVGFLDTDSGKSIGSVSAGGIVLGRLESVTTACHALRKSRCADSFSRKLANKADDHKLPSTVSHSIRQPSATPANRAAADVALSAANNDV